MAIALPGRDRVPPGPTRDFVEALHDLYDLAGQPAARQISRAIYKSPDLEAVSHETVSSVLRGDKVPAWGKVQSVVTVLARRSIREVDLDEMISRFHELWIAVRRLSGNGADADPATPGDPGGERHPIESAKPAKHQAPGTPPGPVPRQVPATPPAPAAAPATAPALPSAPAAPTRPLDFVARVVGSLPERNPHFTGREILLDTMRAHHQRHPNAPLVLFGLGGVGKTQLAREYVHRYADDYSVVWWVPADRAEQARGSLVGLAERLDLPLRQSAEQTIAGVLSRLESQQINFLLVFDGAEDDGIRRLLPAIGGNVIVTSRDPAWAHDTANVGLEVPDFDFAEAIQFLRKRDCAMTGQQAGELTRHLGRFPLGLEQVAALRLATDLPWEDLVARLAEPGRGLFSTPAAEPAHYPHTVAASLQLALDQLRGANPVAVQVFELFAWFGSEPVSVPLLRRGAAGDLSPGLRRTLGNPIDLRRAVLDINRYGLGRLHTHDQRIEVQPLMRLVLRDSLADDDRERARRNVQEILTAADQGWPDELGLWDMHRAMAPHVLPAGLIESRRPAAVRAVHHQIRYRYLLGDYEDARRLGEAAVTTWRDPGFLGPDHELVLLATREWANALRALGRYSQARDLTADAMTRLHGNPRYGDDHPYTLDMARSHAADLRIAGEYRKALELDEASYQRHVRRYREDSDRTVSSRHNLAVSLRLLGDFAGAERIDRAEVARHRERRGERDRRTLLAVNALAEDLFGLGRYQEVLGVQSTSLEIGQSALRRGDQGILLARRMVALARRRLGEVGPAAELLRETCDECVESLGADHELTLAATMSYANALRERRRHGEAYACAMDAVNAYEHGFGHTNPLTLAAQVNLAVILRARGERHQARRADDAACRGLREIVGERHPFTIAAMINLATDMAIVGDRSGALEMSKRAWALAREVRGPQHPDTLAAAANLTLDRLGADAQPPAGPPLDEVLADLRRTLGGQHPTVANVAGGVRIECDVEPPVT